MPGVTAGTTDRLVTADGADAEAPTVADPRGRWRAVEPVAAVILIALAAVRFLAVDIAGIVTNDSLGYLQRSAAPFEEGFVTQGYRQVAYPLSMWFSNAAADVFGWDRIFGMALSQRVLLAGAIGVTVWAMRWWSVPIVVLATSATFVVHVDFLLPEGMLIPLSLLCGALLAAIVLGRPASPASARVVLVAMCAANLLAATIKMQYVVLVALCAAGAWLLVRDRLVSRRLAIACLAAIVGSVTLLALVQSVENRHEYGVFEPISERSLAEWYGAWTAVFKVNPDRADDRALAEWYDDGNLYTAFSEAQEQHPDYSVRREALRRRIDDMFEAADTSAPREHVAAFLGSLRGGRTDDISGYVNQTLAAAPGDALRRISYNRLAWAGRTAELIDDLNGGRQPGFVSFGPVFDAAQGVGADHRQEKGALAVVSIALMLATLLVPGRHRAASVGILSALVVTSALLATGYVDNARYVLGPLTVCVIGGVLALRAGVQFARESILKPRFGR
jgi:hypothetical protein